MPGQVALDRADIRGALFPDVFADQLARDLTAASPASVRSTRTKSQVIGAFEAKTRLSELLDRVDKGQVYVITKRGRPVAELRPAARGVPLRFGSDAGRITIRDDFDAGIPDFAGYTE